MKITKKDKLDAMLQMWLVLRHENKSRPFRTVSSDYKTMMAFQVSLATMLGITAQHLKVVTDSANIETADEYDPEKAAEKKIAEAREDELSSPEA